MKVRELIAILELAPGDAVVRIEGCDCIGWAVKVMVAKSQKSVLIQREHGVGDGVGYDDEDEGLYNESQEEYERRVG